MQSFAAGISSGRFGRLGLVVAAVVLLTSEAVLAEKPGSFIDELRQRLGISSPIEAGTGRPTRKSAAATARGITRGTRALREFYAKQGFRSTWFSDRGPTPKARIFLERLDRVDQHGLRREDYHYKRLSDGVGTYTRTRRAELEILMSRAFVRYGADINAGRIVQPRRVTRRLYIRTQRPDPERLLTDAASAQDFAAFIDRLPPQTPQYRRLVNALAFYGAIARGGGWGLIAAGPTLKPGMNDPRIRQARLRLRKSGDLKTTGEVETLYTKALAAAVRRFQIRHGLTPDGNIGVNTLAAMNVPVARRVQQIVLNLERRRWMPDDLGDRYVFVNIADQQVKLVVNAGSAKPKTVFASRVIVGKHYQSTPIFSATMLFIELNPHWNVPQSIARRELLPRIKKNPSYLTSNHYLLLARPVDNRSAISPGSVDWSKMSARSFPYWIRQTPGPWNALGSLVFRFPNPHNVYMHDTPSKALFAREVRTFSHGCIRVQYPIKLALQLIKANASWNDPRIARTIGTRKPTRINLRDPVPVHVTYLTAWSNKDGTHHFRRDVYRRDDTLARLLARKAPGAKF